MKESYRKSLANYPVPESCVASREAAIEALTGAQAGRVLSCEIREISVPTASSSPEGHTTLDDLASRGWTLRSRRPRACLETPRARTGRPHNRPARWCAGPGGQGDEP